MPDNNKIIKFRTRREINIGLVIALGVLIIITVNVVRGYTKPHLSVYEVQEGSAGSEARTTAMILRPEKVVLTKQAGYLNFYYREGARVAKDADVYSVNDSNDLQHYIDLNENSSVLSENDLSRLKQNMRAFSSSYSDVRFSECYIVREEFLSDYLRYRDISMLDTLGTVQDIEKDFVTYQTDESGVITYYSDLYDGYTVDDITGIEFEPEHLTVPEYKKPMGLSAMDHFAYKLVYDDSWQLVIQMSDKEMERLKSGGAEVSFRISGESTLYTCPYTEKRINGVSYLVVDMDKYGIQYLEQRFTDVTVYLAAKEGLKIPETAILQKELYQIPERFIMRGGGTRDELGVSMELYDAETGEVRPDFCSITPLFYENGYYYVAKEDLDSDKYVNSSGLNSEPERAMLYSFLTNMEGVYNINKGYAVFRRIERITDIEDYVLVRAGLTGGVSLYDHIILDVSTVSKDVILIEGES